MELDDITANSIAKADDQEVVAVHRRLHTLAVQSALCEQVQRLHNDVLLPEFEKRGFDHRSPLQCEGHKMRGLYLVEPHGQWIADGKKKAIAKGRRFDLEGEWIVVSKADGQGKAFGTATIGEPKEVDLQDFDNLFDKHRVSKEERMRWWPNAERLWVYPIEAFEAYAEPKRVEVPAGVQTVMREVDFDAEDDKGIRQLFGSPGGKSRLAKTIVALIPEHKTYVEPFAGGAAVLFAKEPSEKEVLADADGDIARAYRVVKGLSEGDVKRLQGMDWRLGSFDRIKASSPDGDTAWLHKWLYLRKASQGALSGTVNQGQIRQRGLEGSLSPNFDGAASRLANVAIRHQDYAKTLSEFDAPDTFFYLDPPYPDTRRGAAREDLRWTQDDVGTLADRLKSVKGKWLLSLQDTPANREAFKKYHIRGISVGTVFDTGGDESAARKRKELLIANYPLPDRIRRRTGSKQRPADVLKALSTLPERFVWIPDFVALTGSQVYAKDGRQPNDTDVVLRARQEDGGFVVDVDASFALKLERLLQDALGDVPVQYTANAYGPDWSHVPLYSLCLVRKPTLEVVDVAREEPEFAEQQYKALTKNALDRKLRSASDAVKQAAWQTYDTDTVKPGRMVLSLKPMRPAKAGERQTADVFVKYVTDTLGYPVYVSPKRDGFTMYVHSDGDKVWFYSDDGADYSGKLPTLEAAFKRSFKDKSFVLGCELEKWVDGQHFPREASIAAVKTGDDTDLAANIFAVVYYDGEDLHQREFGITWDKTMSALPVDTKSGGALRPRKDGQINLVPHTKVDNEAELKAALEKIAFQPGVEGVVVKTPDGGFPLSGEPDTERPEQCKFHKSMLFTAVVLDSVPSKTEGTTMYVYGLPLD